MKYLLLIYENEANFATITEEEGNKIFAEYMDYTKGIRKSGNYVSGEALQPVATASTVRVQNGKTLTTDGPFAETKEQLGGFYLVEAADLDEATRIANRIPIVRTGSVEVRPILPTPPIE
jgi:hypothetical protein